MTLFLGAEAEERRVRKGKLKGIQVNVLLYLYSALPSLARNRL